jgi:hypothetical protein
MDPSQAMFIGMLATIRASNGDPLAPPEAAQIAELVLTGKADPVDCLIAAAPVAVRQQVASMITAIRMMGMGDDVVFRLTGIIQAALAPFSASCGPSATATPAGPCCWRGVVVAGVAGGACRASRHVAVDATCAA